MKFITERLAAVAFGLMVIIVGLISPRLCMKLLEDAVLED